MTHFTTKWGPEKGRKKLAAVEPSLLPGEDVWFLGLGTSLRPMVNLVALTSVRLVAFQDRDIKFEATYGDIASLTTDERKGTAQVVRRDGSSVVLRSVPKDDLGAITHYFRYGQGFAPPADLARASEARSADVAAASARSTAAKDVSWPKTTVKGNLSRKASEAILRQCQGDEQPWLILTSSGGAGSLVAFDDRLVIIKTGGLTSFMAGSLGGERSATFHLRDITGIEYNSGFVNGVLEILTPSYDGTANRDYWRGTGRSRNADSNDPWTLSNCLPLSKLEYNNCLAEVNELKARVVRSKREIVQAPAVVVPATEGIAEQLERLAALHSSGILSGEEFAAAKARILA